MSDQVPPAEARALLPLFDAPCPHCGGDADAPRHAQVCDGRQGRVEAAHAVAEEDAVPGRKRIAETSREAYQALRPVLPTRDATTRAGLQEYIAAYGVHPTSGELTDWLCAQARAFDVNSVRPSLTRMKDAHVVEVLGKRPCRRSGRTSFVWGLV